MNYITENPKASITAFIGILIAVLQLIVPMDFLTPEMKTNINLVLYPVIVFLLGHWTRINKEQAEFLKKNDSESKIQLQK